MHIVKIRSKVNGHELEHKISPVNTPTFMKKIYGVKSCESLPFNNFNGLLKSENELVVTHSGYITPILCLTAQ